MCLIRTYFQSVSNLLVQFFLLMKRTKPVKLEKVMEWCSTGICLYEWLEISEVYCIVPDRLSREAQSGTVSCLNVKKCSLPYLENYVFQSQ